MAHPVELMHHHAYSYLLRLFKPLVTCTLAGLLACALAGCGESRSADSPGAATAPTPSREAVGPATRWATNDPGLLLLLVPEGQPLTHPQVTAWLDAASEEGVRLQPVTDREFMALGANALNYAGLVLPDQLHAIASDALIEAVRQYTLNGGHTLLVYDFGTFTLDGNQKPTYPIPKSRLSDLAGVDYALYDALREKSTAVGPVMALRSTLRDLQVPPGKSIAYDPASEIASATASPSSYTLTRATQDTQDAPAPTGGANPASLPPAEPIESYNGYLLGHLVYSGFVTQGAFNGKVLATSASAGLVAGLHKAGRGEVLFVNLPLTYLKVVRTDALPLHGFLHYFAHSVLHMAHLSAVPNAVPGLTLNWHLDSFTAQQPALTLEKLGVFNEGPFSIDMTAGPDAVTPGDGKGWNLDNNPIAKDLLQRLAKKGHAIGSHGGWNHDYYGLNANEGNRATFLPYLEKNLVSVRRSVSRPFRAWLGLDTPTPAGTPPLFLPLVQMLKSVADTLFGPLVREYSPPVGNNPLWAMDWLEQQGIVGAYFAGHTGLGPTRQYREGQLHNPGMWMFPVTPAGRFATFEEFQVNRVPKQEVTAWYHDMVDFTISHNTTRMVYMHPNGANVWPDVLQDFLAYARSKGSAQFQW
ncbi:MAG: hypothetical protein ABIP46_01040, partial [Polaromonas sp.]